MRRTNEEFINEVYERRKAYIKKQKQRNVIICALIPVFFFGIFMLPAMMPAMSADKSAPPESVLMGSSEDNQSSVYPPGTIIVTVNTENESYTLEGTDIADFTEKHFYDGNRSQSSSSVHDEVEDSKITYGEKICSFTLELSDSGIKKRTFCFYEKGIENEETGEFYSLSEEEAKELKRLLNI
ncbi:MAG: hypothetical protein UHM85_00470 [Acutalibacteraceae bacterium]|nr:hypothetical protein [Acutalibacteraceae bacterium]